MKYTAQALVNYIHTHSCKAWVAKGMIMVVDTWVRPGSGVWVDEIITLPIDMGKVRAWLGY